MKIVYVLYTLILISIVSLVSSAVYTSGNVTFYSPSVNDQQYVVGESITIDAVVPSQFATDAVTINFFYPNSTLAATIPATVNSTGGIYVPNAYKFPNAVGIWTITVEVAGGVAVGSINVNVTSAKAIPVILLVSNLAMYENTYPQFVELVNNIITAVVMQNGTVTFTGAVYNSSITTPLAGAQATLTLTIPSVGTKTLTSTTASNGSFSFTFYVPSIPSTSLEPVSSYLINGVLTVTYGVHTVSYTVLISAIPNYLSIINLLSNNVNTLEAELQSLNNTITSLKSQLNVLNTSLSSQISTLKANISELSSQISALKANISTLVSEINTLNSQYSTLNSQVSKLNSQISSLNATINSLTSEVSSLKSTVSTLTTLSYGGIIAGIIGLIVAIVAIVLVARRIS